MVCILSDDLYCLSGIFVMVCILSYDLYCLSGIFVVFSILSFDGVLSILIGFIYSVIIPLPTKLRRDIVMLPSVCPSVTSL